MSCQKKYIAFFDLDNTILSLNSGRVLTMEAFKSGLMSRPLLGLAFYYSLLYKFNLRNHLDLIAGMAKWLKGRTLDEINRLSERVVRLHLVNAIRPQVIPEIKFHRENNAEVVILSSVITEICNLLGSYLGTDNQIGTRMEVANGILTGLPHNKFCFEEEKMVRLKEYCTAKNFDLNEAYYYGDSYSDIHALEVVGNPVCVTPDRRLRRIATERKWPIYNW